MPIALYIISVVALLVLGGMLALFSVGLAFMSPMLYDSVTSVRDAPIEIHLLVISLASYPLVYLISLVMTIVRLARHAPQKQTLLTASFPLGYALLCLLVVGTLMLLSSR